jgi:hypothetical protein
MTGRLLTVCSLALVLALPGRAGAGELRLAIQNGRVALSARDVTLRQILIEWERVGGTRIVNRDRVPGTLLTLELVNVPEGQALETLLRSTAGYVAARRLEPAGGASQFSRIVLMPGEAILAPTAPPPSAQGSASSRTGMGGAPGGRPQVQRRVLADGRVVTVIEDPQQPGDPDDTEDSPAPQGGAPGMMRPPFQAPPRLPQGQAAGEPTQPDASGMQTSPPTKSAPTIPVTVAAPGALPTAKPNPTTPPGPPRPPGR